MIKQTWLIDRYKLGQKRFWSLLNNLEDWGYSSMYFSIQEPAPITH